MSASLVPAYGIAELRDLQLDRLRTTLRSAYDHVPHYRHAFTEAGVTPEDLHELADLARFPFTAKADLRANYPFGMFAVPREQVARVHASSGDDGQADRRGLHGEADLDTWAEVMARSIRAAGGRPGDLCHVAYGYGLFTGGLGAHYGAERLGCTVVPVSGRDDRAAGAADPRLRAADHHGDPVVLPEHPRRARGPGRRPQATSLEIGIFGAEPWTERCAARSRSAPACGRSTSTGSRR